MLRFHYVKISSTQYCKISTTDSYLLFRLTSRLFLFKDHSQFDLDCSEVQPNLPNLRVQFKMKILCAYLVFLNHISAPSLSAHSLFKNKTVMERIDIIHRRLHIKLMQNLCRATARKRRREEEEFEDHMHMCTNILTS